MIDRIKWFATTVAVFSNWAAIYRRRFLPNKDKGQNWTLAVRNGPVFEVAEKDTVLPVIVEVWRDRVYGDLSLLNAPESPTVIDIGANIGSFSLLVLSRVPNARVWSFEPEPTNAQLLQRNVERNHFESRATVVPKAVAGKAGPVTLYQTGKNTGTNSMYFKTASSVTVDAVSLDDIFSTYGLTVCDFMKIDCEGAEYDILLSASTETLHKIKKLVLEWHDVEGHTLSELTDHLKAHDFAVEESRTHRLITATRR